MSTLIQGDHLVTILVTSHYFSMVTKSHYLQRFLVTDPKIFLKEPLAPVYTNTEGVASAEKKRNFFFQIFFKKCPKLTFSAFLFKIMPAVAEILAKTGTF